MVSGKCLQFTLTGIPSYESGFRKLSSSVYFAWAPGKWAESEVEGELSEWMS